MTVAPIVGLSVSAGRSAVVSAIVGVSVVGPAVGPEMVVFFACFGHLHSAV